MSEDEIRKRQVQNIISRSQSLLLNVKILGADISIAKDALDLAREAFKNNDYDDAIEHAKLSMIEIMRLKRHHEAEKFTPDDLEGMKKEELIKKCELLGLNTSGNKTELKDSLLDYLELKESDTAPEASPAPEPVSDGDAEIEMPLAKAVDLDDHHISDSDSLFGSEDDDEDDNDDDDNDNVIKFQSGPGEDSFEKGFSYLIEEDRAHFCFQILSKLVKNNFLGLCICRSNPNKIKENFGLENTSMYWLTDRESNKETTISPSLENMIYVAEEFIDRSDEAVLLLDGLEYLISNNAFNPVLRFLRRLIDKISETESILLISVSPKAINEQELKLLEREMKPLKI
jgi:hypothetical protein